jgi:hypothetical protein
MIFYHIWNLWHGSIFMYLVSHELLTNFLNQMRDNGYWQSILYLRRFVNKKGVYL